MSRTGWRAASSSVQKTRLRRSRALLAARAPEGHLREEVLDEQSDVEVGDDPHGAADGVWFVPTFVVQARTGTDDPAARHRLRETTTWR